MNPMRTLMGALPIVAAAFGRKFGVQVQVGGDRACTNSKVIQIPAIGEDPDAATLAWGYLTHEAAHVRYTDFQAAPDVIAKGGLVRGLLGILEDLRIENAILGPYPGARGALDEVMGWLVKQGKTSAPKENDPPPMVLGNAVLAMARHRYRKQGCLKGVATEAERVLRKTFPRSFVHRLLGLLTEVPGMRSTQEAADLAKRIGALVEEEAQDPPPPPEQPTESESDQGEGDGDSAGQSEDGGDDAGQSGDAEGEDDGDSAGQSESDEGEGDGDDAGQSGDDGAEGEDDGEGRKALRAVLSAGAGDLPGDIFEEVAKALGQHATPTRTVLLPSLEQYDGDHAQGQVALQRVRGESAKLTARLQGLVQATQRTAARTVRRGNRLDPTKLYRVGVKDDRIFARRDEKVAPNTALGLVVDLSGSMGMTQYSQPKDDYRVALDAAMALALALESINGVSCAAVAFPGQCGERDRVTRILSHGDRVARRAGAFVQSARGGTPMTGALWYAAADLLARREERKVILVMTDGQPDDFGRAKDMVTKATAAGIELIGVGIGVQVGNLFPVAIRIGSVADLKSELFGIAERLLLR